MTEFRDALHSSKRLAEAARELAHAARALEVPSDSDAVLANLVDAQRSIGQVLGQLAEWHRSTMAGRHYAEGHDESRRGVITAVMELDLAVQQADGLKETLTRAHGGNKVVRWFDVAPRND
ncbi:hypothetical protein [Arthrobacter sp. M4]|uniref:hypothetical protein n=1 Tax=Arthrobacter sp. M4 TaxID=218160 RepID=UPI001CDCA847|nr:hypothetical protein [Arthrobacter sp. M4]MCA4135309.1 hypothetical protein [Arthrobacter sp. M4]